MIELRFHRDLYAGEAVDEAARAFADHADCKRIQTVDAWVLRVTARRPGNERVIARELANYALGLTIERGGPR